ncbi:serine/arginine-rich splicing factor SR45-like [Heterocephalus glaber]|uniref:Serine/arginine-rich splicing factor SR45-like n=1 Tax=Heterocephalus glaber TaxID=10181 RepID=A0AAX6TBR0_HETGA|nr:serine/arginine-rich splicing factor SR45-like [Heterocephalus glaber]
MVRNDNGMGESLAPKQPALVPRQNRRAADSAGRASLQAVAAAALVGQTRAPEGSRSGGGRRPWAQCRLSHPSPRPRAVGGEIRAKEKTDNAWPGRRPPCGPRRPVPTRAASYRAKFPKPCLQPRRRKLGRRLPPSRAVPASLRGGGSVRAEPGAQGGGAREPDGRPAVLRALPTPSLPRPPLRLPDWRETYNRNRSPSLPVAGPDALQTHPASVPPPPPGWHNL